MASLFTADGRWFPSGGLAQGPKAIHDYLARQVGRPYVTRHVLTNTRIDVIDRDHAKGTAYLTMYRYDLAHPELIKTLSPALVGVLTDKMCARRRAGAFRCASSTEFGRRNRSGDNASSWTSSAL